MEKIFRIDTDDLEKINSFKEAVDKADGNIIIPQGDAVKLWIISDSGEVTELK